MLHGQANIKFGFQARIRMPIQSTARRCHQ